MQQLDDFALDGKATMVASDGNTHEMFLPQPARIDPAAAKPDRFGPCLVRISQVD